MLNAKKSFYLLAFVLAAGFSLLGETNSAQAAATSSGSWQKVIINGDGKSQAAVVYDGPIYMSTNTGATWVAKGPIRNWTSIACNAFGDICSAVAYDDKIYLTVDSGLTWVEGGIVAKWRSVAMSLNGMKQVALADDGSVYVSYDLGANWNYKDLGIPVEQKSKFNSVSISEEGIYIMAVSEVAGIYVSNDSGLTWVHIDSVSGKFSGTNINYYGKYFYAVASGTKINLSKDYGKPQTWFVASNSPALSWSSINAGNVLDTSVVAVGANSQIWVSSSTVGIVGEDWLPYGPKANWASVAVSTYSDKMTAVTVDGQIYRSFDYGKKWTLVRDSSAPDFAYYGISASTTETQAHITVAYKNIGKAYVANPNAKLRISITNSLSGETQYKVVNRTDFPAGYSEKVRFTQPFPLSTSTVSMGGTMYFIVNIDDLNNIVEKNEFNNIETHGVQLNLPDFLVESLTIATTTIPGVFRVRTVVKNGGYKSSPKSTTTNVLKDSFGNNYWFFFKDFPRSGTKVFYTYLKPMPATTTAFTLRVNLDTRYNVLESYETNNTYSKRYNVKITKARNQVLGVEIIK